MASKEASLSFHYLQLTKHNYETWSFSTNTIFGSQRVWDIVENGFLAAPNVATLTQNQKDALEKERQL